MAKTKPITLTIDKEVIKLIPDLAKKRYVSKSRLVQILIIEEHKKVNNV